MGHAQSGRRHGEPRLQSRGLPQWCLSVGVVARVEHGRRVGLEHQFFLGFMVQCSAWKSEIGSAP